MNHDDRTKSTLPSSPKADHAPKPVVNHDINRRSFLTRVGGLATAAATAGALVTLEPIFGGKEYVDEAAEIGPLDDTTRADASYNYRAAIATAERANPIVSHPDNGDEALYADKCATFSKTLLHDSFGRVDPSSYASF